jgi:hypothetical protein
VDLPFCSFKIRCPFYYCANKNKINAAAAAANTATIVLPSTVDVTATFVVFSIVHLID